MSIIMEDSWHLRKSNEPPKAISDDELREANEVFDIINHELNGKKTRAHIKCQNKKSIINIDAGRMI